MAETLSWNFVGNDQLSAVIENLDRISGQLERQFKRLGDEAKETGRKIKGAEKDVDSFRGSVRRLMDDVGTAQGRVRTVTTTLVGLARVGRQAFASIGQGASTAASAIGSVMSAAAALAGPLSTIAMIGGGLAAVGAIGGLIPAIAALPAAALAGASAMGALKLGMRGVQEALDAGLSGDTEEYTKALKRLTPEARDAVKVIVGLRTEWVKVGQATQRSLFAGAATELKELDAAIRPLAMRWLPQIAGLFNTAGRQFADFLEQPSTKDQLSITMQNVTSAIREGMRTLQPFGRALLDISEAGSSTLIRMASAAGNLAERFAKWIDRAEKSGKLNEFLEKAWQNLMILGGIAGDLTAILAQLFTTSDKEGQTFLSTIKDLTGRMRAFFASEDGQRVIQFFINMGQAIAVAVAMVITLGGWLGKLLGQLERLLEVLAKLRGHGGSGSQIGGGTGGGSGGSGMRFLAGGGDVAAGETVVVGDGGVPEFFTPRVPGRVSPDPPGVGNFDVTAPLVLQVEGATVWQGLLRFKRRSGRTSLGLA